MALLILNAPKADKDKGGKTALEKISMKLSYMLNSKNPDVLTIGEDDF